MSEQHLGGILVRSVVAETNMSTRHSLQKSVLQFLQGLTSVHDSSLSQQATQLRSGRSLTTPESLCLRVAMMGTE